MRLILICVLFTLFKVSSSTAVEEELHVPLPYHCGISNFPLLSRIYNAGDSIFRFMGPTAILQTLVHQVAPLEVSEYLGLCLFNLFNIATVGSLDSPILREFVSRKLEELGITGTRLKYLAPPVAAAIVTKLIQMLLKSDASLVGMLFRSLLMAPVGTNNLVIPETFADSLQVYSKLLFLNAKFLLADVFLQETRLPLNAMIGIIATVVFVSLISDTNRDLLDNLLGYPPLGVASAATRLEPLMDDLDPLLSGTSSSVQEPALAHGVGTLRGGLRENARPTLESGNRVLGVPDRTNY